MTESRKPILCLDFDGVLHSYTSGWQGADVIPDPPVPGAMDFLIAAVSDFEVHIHSSRSHQPNGIAAMQRWLTENLRPIYEQMYRDPKLVEDRIYLKVYRSLQWPTVKPPALVTIDDRAITFTGTWPSIDSLLAFKPWNKP